MFNLAPPLSLQYGPNERIADTALAAEEQQRLAKFRRQWEYFEGRHLKPLKDPKTGKPSGATFNKAAIIATTSAMALFGRSISFSLDADDSATEAEAANVAPDPAEAYLQDVWRANDQDALLLDVGLTGAINGHVFVKVMPPEQGEDVPRLINLDPATVYPTIDPHDHQRVRAWRIQYTGLETDPEADSRYRGKMVVYRQLVTPTANGTRWQVQDFRSLPDDHRWEQVGPTVLWPYSWAPIFGAKNLPCPAAFWGRADLESDLLDQNDALNLTLSNDLLTLYLFAHPKPVVTGASGIDSLDASPGKAWIFSNTDTKAQFLEMHGDLTAGLAMLRVQDEQMHERSFIPPVSVGKLEDVGKLSGTAIALLYRPLSLLIQSKRVLMNAFLGKLNAALLEMGGHGTDKRVVVTWFEVEPKDILEERQTATLDLQNGVASKQTVAEALGYDWEQEEARMAEEAATAVDLMQSQALATAAPSLTTRGGAAAGGGAGQGGGASAGGGGGASPPSGAKPRTVKKTVARDGNGLITHVTEVHS